jgi:hypothetical protein
MGLKREYYVPTTLGELSDKFAEMASKAPEYEGLYQPLYEPHDGPAGEFNATRAGLANVRTKLGDRAFQYLSARVEENWRRLQSGDKGELRHLKLSFGEMAYFLQTRKYRAENIMDDLVEHTEVRTLD